MKVIDIYNESVLMMVEEFIDQYYTYDDGSKAEYYVIGGDNQAPGVIDIAEDFWNIDDIYVALKNNVEKKTLMQRHEYAHDEYIADKYPINLYNYHLGLRPEKKDEEK